MTFPRLYAYQREDLARIEKRSGRAIVALEMGLGKTVETAVWMHRNPSVRPVVVVCPASLKWQWQRELARHVGIRADVLETTRPPAEGIAPTCQVAIINYDVLGPWQEHLTAMLPQLVVLDEAHAVSNQSAQRSRIVRELVRDVPHLLLLTGTPMTNRPRDLWHLLHLLDPKEFPSFFPYAQQFCKPTMRSGRWVYNGAENLDELRRLVAPYMIRRRKDDVLKQLPPKTRTVVPLVLPEPGEYNRAVTNLQGWLVRNGKATKGDWRSQALTKMSLLKHLVAQLKLPAVVRWADDYLTDCPEKLLLFAVHRDVLGELEKHYQGQCVVVHGGITGRARQAAVDRFQTDPKIRVLLGNVRAAGIGLNLTAAPTVAFAELDWVPAIHLQAEDRAHRIGQRLPVSVHYLVAKDTLEERLCEIIQTKQRIIGQVIDGGADVMPLEVFDLLLKELAA